MSAYLVSRAHIGAIVAAAIHGPAGWGPRHPGNGWNAPYWPGTGPVRPQDRARIGRALWEENVRSMSARYPDGWGVKAYCPDRQGPLAYIAPGVRGLCEDRANRISLRPSGALCTCRDTVTMEAMMSTQRLFPGDVVSMPSYRKGFVFLARVVEVFQETATLELLDGGDPTDPDDPGPYKGDSVIWAQLDTLEVVGPAQGRGVLQ